LRDYSRFKITVKGEPKFASFFLNLSDVQLKKRIGDVLDTLKEHPDAGDLVSNTRCGQMSTKDWRSITPSGLRSGKGNA